MRGLQWAVSVGVVFLAACGGSPEWQPLDGPPPDAPWPIDAAIDGQPTDSAEADAPVDGRPIDAPTDASVIDGQPVDAPQSDAAIDGQPADAAVDAMQTDAATSQMFKATCRALQEVQDPAVTSTATADAFCTLTGTQLQCTTFVANLNNVQAAHIHGPAPAGQNAGVAVGFTLPVTNTQTFTLTAQQVADLQAGNQYINIHTTAFSSGEVRGQLIQQSENLYSAQMTSAGAGRGYAGCILNVAQTQLACTGSALNLADAVTMVQLIRSDGSTVAATLTIDAGGTSPRFSGTTAIGGPELTELNTIGWTVRLTTASTTYNGTLAKQQ